MKRKYKIKYGVIYLILLSILFFSCTTKLKGTYTDTDTDTDTDKGEYVGQLNKGKKHGQGTYTYPKKGIYIGEWKDGKKHGQGTYTYPNGGKYIGQWKDGKLHGRGTYISAKGGKYIGEWKDSNQHGHGTYTYAEGGEYVGQWNEGKIYGQGTYIYPKGGKYVGQWKDSKRHGQGTYVSAKGGKYVGQWKDDKKHGHGTYTYADGDKYDGLWKDGKKHGHGTYTYAEGGEYVGQWKDGKKHGQGTYINAKGDKYDGLWKDGKKHGHGTYTYKDIIAPIITIIEPIEISRNIIVKQKNITIDQGKINIKGKAIDESRIYRVLINNIETNVYQNGEFSKEIKLEYGENKIEIEAIDIYNNIGKKGLVIVRPYKTHPKSTQPYLKNWYKKQYALIIGIDNYKSKGIYDLNNAVNDAKSVSKMFRDMGIKVIEIYNSKATKENIKSYIKEISDKVQSTDSFILYFAGHGQGLTIESEDKEAYIIPYDADLSLHNTDVIEYDDKTISLYNIRKYIKNMKAKHVVLLLDSCFSGLVMRRTFPKLKKMTHEYYNDLLSRKSINILTAGDNQPVSDGTDHSPFTKAILEGLAKRGLDINDRDGYVTFSQLAIYVKEKVEKATGRQQRPQFDNLSMEDGDFIFKLHQ